MPNLIAAINTTLDGICDHTAGIPDDELHQHYADLLRSAGSILYGRTTFELMKYWQSVALNPTGNPANDAFARTIDQIPKIVFSYTLQNPAWATARLAAHSLQDEVASLKQEAGQDILVGSRSLIVQLLKLNLVDELQLCLHPVVAGSGSLLFQDLTERLTFSLTKTKAFKSGALVLYYKPLA